MNNDIVAQKKKVVIGVDVHLKKHVVTCRIDGEYTKPVHLKPETVQWERFLGRFPECEITVVYEAGLTGFNLHDWLCWFNGLNGARITPVVLPPARVPKAPGDKVKTDKRDTVRLINALDDKRIHPVTVPDIERREARQVVRSRAAAVDQLKQVKNQIQGMLTFHGADYASKGKWSKKWIEQIRKSIREHDATGLLSKLLEINLVMFEHLKSAVSELTAMARELFRNSEASTVARAIEKQRGVGWLSALVITLETADFLAFKNSEAYASYTGVVPSESSSGDTTRRGGITRVGNANIRRILGECAWTWIRYDPQAAAIYRRIKAGKDSRKNIAITAMMRRLAVRIFHIARNELLGLPPAQWGAAVS